MTQSFPIDQTLLDLKYEQMDALVGNWKMSIKEDDGSNYEPDSLTNMHRVLPEENN